MTTNIPSCAATPNELQLQGERARRLAATVRELRHDEDRLTIEFDAGLDRRLLDETVAAERECCPFFGFEFDDSARRLTVSVAAAEHRPALDALAHSLAISPLPEAAATPPER